MKPAIQKRRCWMKSYRKGGGRGDASEYPPHEVIESMKDAGQEAGLSVEIVGKSDAGLNYLVSVNQIGGLANVVIALQRDDFVGAEACAGRQGHRANLANRCATCPSRGASGSRPAPLWLHHPCFHLIKIWRALTEPELLGQWLMSNDFEPVVGGTRVRMEQSGFRPEDTGFYEGASGGWPRMVAGLERVAGEN